MRTTAPWPQRAGGHLAATAALTYVTVKLGWIVASADGTETPDGWSVTGWVALNAVTVVMAVTGGLLGLGLAREWRRALPTPVLLVLTWLVCGFLVSTLPFMVLGEVLTRTGIMSDDTPPSPGADQHATAAALIGLAFAGIAVGVLVALPSYAARRWPWLRSPGRRLRHRPAPLTPSVLAAAGVAVVVGSWWLAWGAGLAVGARTEALVGPGRLLEATLGGWAVLTGALLLGAGARRRPVLGAAALFVGSGSMTAWGSWRLVVVLWDPPGYAAVAALPLLGVQYAAVAVAGALALHALVSRAGVRPAGGVAAPAASGRENGPGSPVRPA